MATSSCSSVCLCKACLGKSLSHALKHCTKCSVVACAHLAVSAYRSKPRVEALCKGVTPPGRIWRFSSAWLDLGTLPIGSGRAAARNGLLSHRCMPHPLPHSTAGLTSPPAIKNTSVKRPSAARIAAAAVNRVWLSHRCGPHPLAHTTAKLGSTPVKNTLVKGQS